MKYDASSVFPKTNFIFCSKQPGFLYDEIRYYTINDNKVESYNNSWENLVNCFNFII